MHSPADGRPHQQRGESLANRLTRRQLPGRLATSVLLALSLATPGVARAGQAATDLQETVQTISAVPAGATDTFTDASVAGRDPAEFAGRWIRIATAGYPGGFFVRVRAFDSATGRFTLYATLPAGFVSANDTYRVSQLPGGAVGIAPPASGSIGTLSLATLTADRFTGIVEPGGAGGAGADGNDAGFFEGIFFPPTDGAAGGGGGALTTTVHFGPFRIITVGQSGIRSASTGGAGGDGGDNSTLIEANGGDGGRGGNGGSVVVTTTSTTGGIVTSGLTNAPGIVASSRGGNGGNGGDGSALFVGTGGDGALGGNGGAVTVNADNAITTVGLFSPGIIGQSLGGNGGHGGDGAGLVSGGGDGSGSGNGGRVDITSRGAITTIGLNSFGIFAQSVGGFAGAGGGSAGLVTFSGGATSGGAGAVATIDNWGVVTTNGAFSHALFAQSVGGNGGSAGVGSGFVVIGASGADGGRASTVRIDNHAGLLTTGASSRGLFAQSVGGGGGDGGAAFGVHTFGGSGAAGGNAGQVVATNEGLVMTTADAIFAQSVGGGGGTGAGVIGTGFAFGGSGSGGGSGARVDVINTGTLVSGGRGIFAQSLGGGGGDGGFSGGSVAVGGRSGTGGNGGVVDVENHGAIAAAGEAIQAQSVGGGGGSGRLSLGWFSFGGAGGAGGNGGAVTVSNTGSLGTALADSSALFAQSVGGGGGNGAGSIALGAFVSAGFGGRGGAGGDGGQVEVTSEAAQIVTLGARSHGILVQSVGDGGGNGGFTASASIGYIVSVGFGWAGSGASGGRGGVVNATIGGNITTAGVDASGVFAQSVGGGGGNGGWSIAGSGSDSVAIGLSFGGAGGLGGSGSAVNLMTTGGAITTHGVRSHGLFAQSVGKGGGNGGFSIAAAGSGVVAGTLTLGGSGGTGGTGDLVTVVNRHTVTTSGEDAHAIFAQSVGGGGGSGGFSISAGGSGTGAVGLSFGGSGSTGGLGGMVDVRSEQTLATAGDYAVGLFAQSVGGGGGHGRFSISGAGAGSGAGTFNMGGSGGGGGASGFVVVNSTGGVTTQGVESHGLFAQSVGGGGGNGGFSLTGNGAGTGSLAIGVGGSGGTGGVSGSVNVTSRGPVTTWGESAVGLIAQSVGGGGGFGRFSLSGTGAGTGAVSFSLGGSGGTGGHASAVFVASEGAIVTHGEDATGLFAQSAGGGGGRGGFSITGSGAGTGAGSLGLGGWGGGGGNGGYVEVDSRGSIWTSGGGAIGLFAQSVGGGGGNGRFSITGSGAKSGNGALTMGGFGGAGGSADAVHVDNGATITTLGDVSYGILGQSVGGGGGTGGFSFAGGAAIGGGQLNASLGGAGGTGGDAGRVDLLNAATVLTASGGSHGLFAQSLGGGGGAGGFSGAVGVGPGSKVNVSVGIGGWGGVAGDAGAIDLVNHGIVRTGGFASYGLFAQSVGGGGGDGGGSLGVALGSHEGGANLGVAVGGQGATAGNAGEVRVLNTALVETLQPRSFGIYAQSVGGGGGTGGFSATGVVGRGTATKDLAVGVGGLGGAGGVGGLVHVENWGDLILRGGSASGIVAQSIGGGGGDGGFSFAGSFAGSSAKELSVAVGGFGGDGNAAGDVFVTNRGAIETAVDFTWDRVREILAPLPALPIELQEELIARLFTARPAHGIYATSIGGGGGNGGDSVAVGFGIGGATWGLNAGVAVGGFGGTGGTGGRVDVTNDGAIVTRDDDSHGIVAKSVGGGGGDGGAATTAVITTGAANVGRSINVDLSVGGFGGTGNTGGSVFVANRAGIVTVGDESSGIMAQSVGGGGGSGGSSRGVNMLLKFGSAKLTGGQTPGANWKAGLVVGGTGGSGNDGGTVEVNNLAAISTQGTYSRGIFAQSIGGGGGDGGDAIKGTGTKADGPLGLAGLIIETGGGSPGPNFLTKAGSKILAQLRDWQFTVGGNAGASGDATTVTVRNHAEIVTAGYGATAIFAQSVGGGGGEGIGYAGTAGEGGKAVAGATGKVGIGGAGGAAGHGGAVTLTNTATLMTFGESAHGLFAQSVGGGGGVAGSVERVLPEGMTVPVVGVEIPALNIGLGLDWGRDGGNAGNGGAVTVDNASHIYTTGDAAYGIFAQSVGGGGGLAGGLSRISEALSDHFNFAGSVGGDGSGGAVTVTQSGLVRTTGTGADGIFAQSAGGTAFGGAVGVHVAGNIFVNGAGANGILAQSRGDQGGGDVTITIGDGMVLGGAFGGVGVSIVDGATNTLTNGGVILTGDGIAGMAVRGGLGGESVINQQLIVGSIDLGAGANALSTRPGGRFDSGDVVRIGAGNLFTNEGLLSPGGAGAFQTTALTGDLMQTGSSAWLVDLGEIGVSDTLAVAGRVRAGGTTALDLNLLTTPAGNGAYTLLTATGGGIADAGGFRFGSLFGEMPIGRTFDLIRSPVNEQLTLAPSSGTFVWRGATSDVWASPFVDGASNWARTTAGDAIYGTPGAASDVVIGLGSGFTQLGADFVINSLRFDSLPGAIGAAETGVAGPNALTLMGQGGPGLALGGSADATVGVDLVLGGRQAWTHDGTGLLAVVGATVGGAHDLTIGGTGLTLVSAAIDTGTGSLTKEGSGLLVLTGRNEYSGGTTVLGGAVLGNTDSLRGSIVNHGVVGFEQAAAGEYGGVMSGRGTLVKQGPGVLILSGANTYSGGTVVTAGMLQGTTTSLQGDVLNDGAVVLAQSGSGEFAGRLFGAGTFALRGGATFELTGDSRAFDGSTTVTASALLVNGWLGGATLLLQPGSLLGGGGIVPGVRLQAGTVLAPGNSIGTILVDGHATFEAGSAFRVETEAYGSADAAIVTGSLFGSGATVNVIAGGSQRYRPINRYTIARSDSGVIGPFGGATVDVPYLVPSLQYDTHHAFLTLRRNDVDFTTTGTTGNQTRVARVFNALVPTATGAFADRINTVYDQTDVDARRAFTSMAGVIYQHLSRSSLGLGQALTGLGVRRLELVGGEAGALAPSAMLAGDRPGSAGALPVLANPGAALDRSPGVWVSGLGGVAEYDGTAADPGARVPATGFALGADTRLGRHVTVGVTGGKVHSDVELVGAGDRARGEAIYYGAYGRAAGDRSRLDAAVVTGRQDHRLHRRVTDGVAQGFAASNGAARDVAAALRFGYRLSLGGGLAFEPRAGYLFGRVALDAVTESGAGVLNLVVPERQVSSHRSIAGAALARSFGAGRVWSLEGRALWSREHQALPDIRLRFEGDTATDGFDLASPHQVRDSALVGLTFAGRRIGGFQFALTVDGELGGPVSSWSANLGLLRRW